MYRITSLQIPFKTVTLNICKKNVVIVPSISIAIKHLLTYLVDRVHKHCPCTHSLTSDTKGNNYYKHSNVACFYHFSKNIILIGYQILNRSTFHCYSNSLTLIIYTFNFLRHRACLLYTSPSPRDGLLSRMPSSA